MKKTIPDVSEILNACDKKTRFSIRRPEDAKEKAVEDMLENEAPGMMDFTTMTLGDLIGAAHSFNREMLSSAADTDQRVAYFTLFAFEERAKRLQEHFEHVQ
tara:strand:+ start:1651 stop:1956 length:306 start_codon:yes stop_codon:yes gene_type:complete